MSELKSSNHQVCAAELHRLDKENTRLLDEIERLTAERDTWMKGFVREAYPDRDAEIVRLRAALRRYARHSKECEPYIEAGYHCTCGLEDEADGYESDRAAHETSALAQSVRTVQGVNAGTVDPYRPIEPSEKAAGEQK